MFERKGWHRATPLCADTTVGRQLVIYFDDVINVISVIKRIKKTAIGTWTYNMAQ